MMRGGRHECAVQPRRLFALQRIGDMPFDEADIKVAAGEDEMREGCGAENRDC